MIRKTVPTARRPRTFRRYLGAVAMSGVMVATLAVIVSLAIGIYPERNAGFHVIPREPYTHSFDPIALVELGLPPQALPTNMDDLAAIPRDPAVRVISVTPHEVKLMAAGAPLRTIPTVAPVTDMRQLMDLIDDPAWIEEAISGQVTLESALVTYHGVNFTVGAPLFSELLMLDMPSVFIGTRGGNLTLDRVRVHSLAVDTIPPTPYRPFVLTTDRAKMTILNSDLYELGWDWNASYGVSWEQGSTGRAIGSNFERNFIGVYTGRAKNLVFDDCAFRANTLYGLDPHTYSKNLMIDNVVAEDNGAHGIIFSDYVRDSTIKNSISRNNGENGIMMDKYSTGNTIINNVVTKNKGDGMVTAKSARNTFTGNTIEDNRFGVRLSPGDAESTVFTDNKVIGNAYIAVGIDLPTSNALVSNGGQWDSAMIWRIWTTTGVVMVAVAVALAGYLLRRPRVPVGPRLAAV